MTAPDAQPPAARPYGRWIPPAFTLLGHTPKASPTGNSTFSACWECVCGDFLHVTQDGYYAGPAVERHCERAAFPASAALAGTTTPVDDHGTYLARLAGVIATVMTREGATEADAYGQAAGIANVIADHPDLVAALLASTPTEETETDGS